MKKKTCEVANIASQSWGSIQVQKTECIFVGSTSHTQKKIFVFEKLSHFAGRVYEMEETSEDGSISAPRRETSL